MKFLFAVTITAFLMLGCSTIAPTPTAKTPPTPPEFMLATQQPGDQSLSCEAISSQFRYIQIYAEAIERFFDTKGPMAMTSTAYTTTSGVATRYGNTAFGSATSATYGGGTVMVYDTLTLRAMDLTRSVEKRQSELRRLAQRRGDCDSNDLQASHQMMENAKRTLDSAKKDLNFHINLYDSYVKKAVSENRSQKDLEYQKKSYQESLQMKRVTLDKSETRYQALLREHSAMYDRAELEAKNQRKWFDDNTKLVLE